MKFWSIIVLVIFINSLALPSIAKLMDWDSITVTLNSDEDDPSSPTLLLTFEKIVPTPLSIYDFLNFLDSTSSRSVFTLMDDSIHLSPFLLIFSPPPENS